MLDWNNQPIVPPEQLQSVNPCVRLYGPGPDGVQCAGCVHLHGYHQAARWYKCDIKPRYKKGISGDHSVRWPACSKYEKREDNGE